jgi:hypothetical protein
MVKGQASKGKTVAKGKRKSGRHKQYQRIKYTVAGDIKELSNSKPDNLKDVTIHLAGIQELQKSLPDSDELARLIKTSSKREKQSFNALKLFR